MVILATRRRSREANIKLSFPVIFCSLLTCLLAIQSSVLRLADRNSNHNNNNQPEAMISWMLSSSTATPTPTRRQQKTNQKPVSVVVDILSIGSQTQRDLQDAQRATFGSHPAVRHFYSATEQDAATAGSDGDASASAAEANCHKQLNWTHVSKIVAFCKAKKRKRKHNPNHHHHPVLSDMSVFFFSLKDLLQKRNPAGWMCAQKRPLQAFHNLVLQNYFGAQKGQGQQVNWTLLPDYLWVVDDDTWVNVDHVLELAQLQYPSHEPHAVAGCLFAYHKLVFPFAFGGYGVMFTKATLMQWLQPLHCRRSSHENEKSSLLLAKHHNDDGDAACAQIRKNAIGEAHLFQNGMSIADLMFKYVVQFPYLDIALWPNDSSGFCLHSDWVWAYFVQFYNLSLSGSMAAYKLSIHHHQHSNENTANNDGGGDTTSSSTSVLSYYDIVNQQVVGYGECLHGPDFHQQRLLTHHENRGDAFCTSQHHWCHRITPWHMHLLHNQTTTPVTAKRTRNQL